MNMGKKLVTFFIILLLLVVAVGVYVINPFDDKVQSGLQVITDNISSSLFLDGSYLDKTPYINKKIRPGEYTLRIEPESSELNPYETPISLTKGLLTVVTWKPGKTIETSGGVIYEMKPLENKSETEVSFITIPDNAIISFDGGEKKFSPLALKEVDPGHHEFEVSLPSYESQKHTINLIKGYNLNISVKLIRAEEALEETSTEDDTDAAQTEADQAPTDQTQVKILSTNFYQDGAEVLRVRTEANLNSDQVGFVKVDQSYPYLDQTDDGWHQIKFKDALTDESKQGWVSPDYSQLSPSQEP